MVAFAVALLGIIPFAAAIAGYLFSPLSTMARVALFAAAALLLVPVEPLRLAGTAIPVTALAGVVLLATTATLNWKNRAAT